MAVSTIDSSGLTSPLTTALPVTSGGTGATTSTGSGANVLGTSPTIASPTLTSPTISGTPVMGASVITSGTSQASTSGTSISFSSIPSWVKRVTIMLVGVSTNGASGLAVQIGPVAGVETSGYSGYAYTPSSSTSFTTEWLIVGTNSAANLHSGTVFLSLADSATNTWVMSAVGGGVGVNTASMAGGSKAIAGTLSVLRVIGSNTGSPVDTFDAGSINILYE